MGGTEREVPTLDRAWAELDRGAWLEAADAFDGVLAELGPHPRALEGRAWAAWWLDDVATLFRVREESFHASLAHGDLRSAARAAIWLGCDHHEIRGQHAVANGWYQRARRILDGLPTAPEHGWLAFQEGAYAIELSDDTILAKERAAEADAVGRAVGVPDLVFLAAALEGLALVTEGSVDEGMRRLDEAGVAATSGELRERIAVTWTLCYLIYGCERVRDFDRTAQWCDRMQEAATRFGFRGGVGICRVHYGGVLLLHGDWDGAERELMRSRAVLAGVRPMAVPESDARLGELRRRQGRLDEARELLTRAAPHPIATLGLAALALDRDEPATAVHLLEELLQTLPRASATQQADALWLLAAARAELGDAAGAATAAADLEAIADRVGSRPLAAMAAAARGSASLARGDLGAARAAFALAERSFEQAAMPYEAAVARGGAALALARDGRWEAADEHATSAADRLRAIGAPGPAGHLEARIAAVRAPAGPSSPLTPREAEILGLLAEGLKDREVAERLTISPHTVHRHVSNILTKLGVPSRAAAVARHLSRRRAGV